MPALVGGAKPGHLVLNPKWPFVAGAPRAGPPVPQQVSGLAAWFEADAGTSTTTDGAAVSQWNDQSGNAHHAVQATGASQPLYKTATQNGLPGILFDGTDDLMDAAGIVVTQPNTSFVVAKSLVVTTGHNPIDGISTRQGVSLGGAGGTNWGAFAGADVESLTVGDTSPHVLSCTFNGASTELRLDGTLLTLSGSPGTNGLNGLRIGSFNGTQGCWNGYVFEIVVYSAALSTADRQTVEAYLSNKWLSTAAPLTLDASGGSASATGGTTSLAFAYTAASGTATATGGTVSLAETVTAATGTATASGTLPVLSFTYTAASGVATAGGGSVTELTTVPLTASTGVATAGGSSVTLSFTFTAASGTATAGGATSTLAFTFTAASGTATAVGGTASKATTHTAATGVATASGTLPVVTFVYGVAGGTATAGGGSASTGGNANVTAITGVATASGSTTTLAFTYTGAGAATAGGGTLTISWTFSAATGLATAVGGASAASTSTGLPTRWETGDGSHWPASTSTRWPAGNGNRWAPSTDDRWPVGNGSRWN